ncbi:hypothetical protein [Streptomyces sp. NPDC058701]
MSLGLDEAVYEIDLASTNADRLREPLEPCTRKASRRCRSAVAS